jgi:uncharacterized membrane protein
LCAIFFSSLQVHAQETSAPSQEVSDSAAEDLAVANYTPNTYVLGEVLSVVEEGTDSMGGMEESYQLVLVKVASGESAGEVITVEYRSSSAGFAHVRLEEGSSVILVHMVDARGSTYYIQDHFRLPIVLGLALFFGILAIVLGRKRGFMSLVGLGVSLIVLTSFVIPHIMSGDSPLLISAIGAVAIAMSSLFLAHGFTKRTTLAFLATMFVLALAFGLAYATVMWATLSGASTEEAIFLQMGYLQTLDLRGLLLGGLVIGALGVLDDVTTAQVAAVEEIARANRALDAAELYKRGIAVGREHIASLVNTLALAYVGASFPLFLLFSLPDNPPLWVILNSESITEELLRALIGGSALMLAVPISTMLAAWAFGKGWIKIREEKGGGHSHIHAH